MIQLYDYQASDQFKALEALKTHKSVLFQASTGYGKTIVLTDIAKKASDADRKVLVLVNREELLTQTREALISIGISSEPINDKTTFLLRNTNVYVAMVESIYNRLSENNNFLKDINLIITDECHIQVFKKVVDFFPEAKEIGFTATPVLNQREKYLYCPTCALEKPICSKNKECVICSVEMYEYSRPKKMSDLYESFVEGFPIHKLIERGGLVPEMPFSVQATGLENLKENNGDFTTKSLNEVYETDGNLASVYKNYLAYCEGKKTIIFNSSTKINKKVYKELKGNGVNVRMFDTVNSEESGDRKKLLEWFKNTSDAVLLNVGTFTTGFDEPTIEACILNLDTLSLALYLQMVGRAGRSCKYIYKPHFILIDCGRNIERFGLWSDETRDWEKIFYNGIGEDKPVRKMPEGFETCEECWTIFSRNTKVCPNCAKEIEPNKPNEKSELDLIAQPLRRIPPPNANAILNYVKFKNENINFGHKVLISQILDMFVFYRVDSELYKSTKENGNLKKRINDLLRPTYFILLNSDLEGSKRTLRNLEDRILKRLEKMYNK